MNEMVKRVMLAIEQFDLDSASGFYEKALREATCAAIKAMREPTEAMKRAGTMVMPDYDPSMDDAETCWQTMIDAALAEELPEPVPAK